jgi:hypothetical protein
MDVRLSVVSVDVLSGRGICVGPITGPECGASKCDRISSVTRRHWRTRGCCDIKNQTYSECMAVALVI